MKLLLGYLKNYWKLIVLALFLASINQIFSLLDPYIFRLVIDNYVSKVDHFTRSEFFWGVFKLLMAGVGVAFVSRVAKNFQDYYVNTITQRLSAKMYTDGLKHSLELPYQVFEDQRSGETLGKLVKVRADVEKLVQTAVNVLFTTLVGFVFVIVYAIRLSWIIALVYFITVPIIGFVSSALSKKIKKVQTKIVAETTALAGSTTESLRNIELVKSSGLSQQEIVRLNQTTLKILGLELEKVKYIRSISFVQGTIVDFLRKSIMFIMLSLIFLRYISFGQFFSLYIYSFFLFQPLQDLGNIITTFREAEASLKNFSDILATPKEKEPAQPKTPGKVSKIEFRDVGFKHLSAPTPALSGISFAVNLGETAAFVGPSGAGKSTLVKLLVGLYQPKVGEVLYNNISASEIKLDALREQIGFVTQDTQLFAGTIRENLLFVKPEATDAELTEVLQKAAAQNLLSRAENGLETKIGEGGMKVSGGEKQRLAIARALLRKPNLLVFDEATSSLDSLTENEITQTIRSVSESKSHITVLIAHRLSTILHADKIYVLEKGKITEQGKHQELLDQKGLYYAMWRQQIGEREDGH